MKKLLLLVAVFAFVGTAVQAQCTKSKTAATTGKTCTKTTAMKVADAPGKFCVKSADAAMMQDHSIVKKVSDMGEVSYAKKKTCAASGKVSYADVKYCSKSKAFVNVAPAADDATAMTVAGAEKKVCSKAVAAALGSNPDVEKRTCATSGKVSYMQKKTCAASGKVSYNEVKYCSNSKAFVNAAPTADDATAITVAGAEKKVCSKAVAAALGSNPDVEKRTCAASGKVSYMQKKTCAASGKVSFNEVKYCSDSKAFVNVAPADAMNVSGTKKSCTAAQKAACTKSANAKGVSLNADGTTKKSCSKPCAKTCTKGAKKASLKKVETNDVKVIKTSNQ